SRRVVGTLTWLMVGLTAAAVPAGAAASKHHAQSATKQAAAKQSKPAATKSATKSSAHEHATAASKRHHEAKAATKAASKTATASDVPLPPTDPRKTQLPGDLGVLQRAMSLVRQRQFADARNLSATIEEPAAKKLIEWAVLRNADSELRFD